MQLRLEDIFCRVPSFGDSDCPTAGDDEVSFCGRTVASAPQRQVEDCSECPISAYVVLCRLVCLQYLFPAFFDDIGGGLQGLLEVEQFCYHVRRLFYRVRLRVLSQRNVLPSLRPEVQRR